MRTVSPLAAAKPPPLTECRRATLAVLLPQKTHGSVDNPKLLRGSEQRSSGLSPTGRLRLMHCYSKVYEAMPSGFPTGRTRISGETGGEAAAGLWRDGWKSAARRLEICGEKAARRRRDQRRHGGETEARRRRDGCETSGGTAARPAARPAARQQRDYVVARRLRDGCETGCETSGETTGETAARRMRDSGETSGETAARQMC